MELKEYLKVIEQFVRDYLESTHCKQYVLGLSGGVDSSLVAALTKSAVGKDKLTCIMIPIDSHPADLDDALELAKDLDLNYLVIDGSKAFHAIKEQYLNQGIELDTIISILTGLVLIAHSYTLVVIFVEDNVDTVAVTVS